MLRGHSSEKDFQACFTKFDYEMFQMKKYLLFALLVFFKCVTCLKKSYEFKK